MIGKCFWAVQSELQVWTRDFVSSSHQVGGAVWLLVRGQGTHRYIGSYFSIGQKPVKRANNNLPAGFALRHKHWTVTESQSKERKRTAPLWLAISGVLSFGQQQLEILLPTSTVKHQTPLTNMRWFKNAPCSGSKMPRAQQMKPFQNQPPYLYTQK